jgi:hypothetical protein
VEQRVSGAIRRKEIQLDDVAYFLQERTSHSITNADGTEIYYKDWGAGPPIFPESAQNRVVPVTACSASCVC